MSASFSSVFSDGASGASSIVIGGGTPTPISGGAAGQLLWDNGTSVTETTGITTDGTNLTLASASRLLWSTDLILTRLRAASLQLGGADAAAPVAQTFGPQSVVAGTTNTAGAAFILRGSAGTGTGVGGAIKLQIAGTGTTGSTQNAFFDILTADILGMTLVGQFTLNGSVLGGGHLRAGNTSGIYWTGRSTMWSDVDANIRLGDSLGTSFGRLQFGGTAATFPALKRSTTSLQARLADDSAFTNIQGKLTTDTAYTAGAAGAATGYIVLYDSTGTAYKVEARL